MSTHDALPDATGFQTFGKGLAADRNIGNSRGTPAGSGSGNKARARRRPGSVAARETIPSTRRLFVLDTNVLMHDPSCLFRFDEHDLYLPLITLEELDDHKKGMSEVSRNVRQVSRLLDTLIDGHPAQVINVGLPLQEASHGQAGGRLFLQTDLHHSPPLQQLQYDKADNQILAVVAGLNETQHEHEVVLVSKDINMRIKARALGLIAEDYFNDQLLEDNDLLYTGTRAIDNAFWERNGNNLGSWKENRHSCYRLEGPDCATLLHNQLLYQEDDKPFYAYVKSVNGQTAILESLCDFRHEKNRVWGITARNREQNFALNLLMNPEIDFVTLLGQAGTGKTLLTLAAALAQTLDQKRYSEIIITRATVPVGEDIGYLPGGEEEKMAPWMGALEDNLEVLHQGEGGEWERAATRDLIGSRIKIKSMSFMRGRTFLNKFLILDEAQNLTPKQIRTLITRAGPNTKVVCMGNIAQIDTPYLTEGSSGITYVIEHFKGWVHSGHVTLQRGERSRLADYASEVLR